MLPIVTLILTLTALPANPVDTALAHVRQLTSYRMTLRSGHGDNAEVIRYSYKKPGFVRMDFIKPHHGAVLVYSPVTRQVRLRPFGIAKPLVLTLSPDNSLVKSSHGHRVDASDLGSFLERVQKLQRRGTTRVEGKTAVGRNGALEVSVEGNKDFAVAGVHRYRLWLDTKTLFPVKTMAYDLDGNLLEEVSMEDLELNPELPDDYFQL